MWRGNIIKNEKSKRSSFLCLLLKNEYNLILEINLELRQDSNIIKIVKYTN